MATVLMGWELGAGFGHVVPLRAVARALAQNGHRPVFLLRNVVEPWPVLNDEPFPVMQAPLWTDRNPVAPFRARSYADILVVRGWSSVDDLRPQVEDWQALLDLIQPSLIVCDHSPTLCLAAFGVVPTVVMGSWFCVPPADGPRFALLPANQNSRDCHEEVLGVVQRVQRERGRPVPQLLPEVLTSARCFPTALPETDCYRAFRKEATWDPLEPLPAPASLGPDAGFFAYLSGDNPHAEAVLTGFARTGCRGAAYLRGAAADVKDRLRRQGVNVLDQPASWPTILAHGAVIVHHGGAGMTQGALAAGRPQILLPQYLEQGLSAKTLQELGVGMALTGPALEAPGQVLLQLLNDRRFAERAMVVAREIHQRPRRPPLPAIVEHCVSCLS